MVNRVRQKEGVCDEGEWEIEESNSGRRDNHVFLTGVSLKHGFETTTDLPGS